MMNRKYKVVGVKEYYINGIRVYPIHDTEISSGINLSSVITRNAIIYEGIGLLVITDGFKPNGIIETIDYWFYKRKLKRGDTKHESQGN